MIYVRHLLCYSKEREYKCESCGHIFSFLEPMHLVYNSDTLHAKHVCDLCYSQFRREHLARIKEVGIARRNGPKGFF